jgi:hypothetical protein
MRFVLAAVALLWFSAQPGKPDLDRLLDKLDAYLADYEPALGSVVADEVVLQETTSAYLTKRRKRMDAEFAFLRLPGDLEWMGFRHVKAIDGKPVDAKGPGLTELLATTTADAMAQAQLLVTQSSKHNMGLPRTLNMPGLPLELLNPRYRPRFDVKLAGRERLRGRATRILTLTERGSPAIIVSAGDDDLQSAVTAWIDEQTGAVRRADIVVSGAKTRTFPYKLRIEFAEDKALGLVVPVTMREDFWVDLGTGRGEYAYSNFRRFGTSARIVPQ